MDTINQTLTSTWERPHNTDKYLEALNRENDRLTDSVTGLLESVKHTDATDVRHAFSAYSKQLAVVRNKIRTIEHERKKAKMNDPNSE